MVIYTDWFIPSRFSGYTIGPIVLIRPRCKDDIGLREHELTHVRQFKETWGLNGLRYAFSKKWRWRYEAEAYRTQLKYDTNCTELFAWYLATNYNLDITLDEAKASLVDENYFTK